MISIVPSEDGIPIWCFCHTIKRGAENSNFQTVASPAEAMPP
jgi:hypothetical protein